MAGVLEEKLLAKQVYATLQAVSCPLVEGLYLQEADSMQQLLCTTSQHRTDILAWICSSINQFNISSKLTSLKSKDPDGLTKEMAAFGQELMLCKANDLDLIRGQTSPWRQLQFLEQLLTLVPGCGGPTECKVDGEGLLGELFAPENQLILTQMLNPSLDPWPADVRALLKGQKSSSYRLSEEEAADVAALLLCSQAALEELQSECEFLRSKAQSPSRFSPCALRVGASDLSQLMAVFSRVYGTDFRAYCNRETPSLSSETHAFYRVHQLLLACNTELEMLKGVSEASVSMTDRVNQLQTQPHYWSCGEKRTLSDQLEELTRRYRYFLSLHQV